MHLTTRIALLLSACQVFTIGATSFFAFRNVRQDLRTDFANRVSGMAEVLSQGTNDDLCRNDYDTIRGTYLQAVRAGGLSHVILHHGSKSLVTVGDASHSLYGVQDPMEFKRRVDESGVFVTFVSMAPCEGVGSSKDSETWDVEVGANYAVLAGSIQSMTQSALIGVIVEILVAITLTIWVGRLLNRRIISIQDALRKVSYGDFSARIPSLGSDEYGAISKMLNQMFESLEMLVAEQDRQRQTLATSAKLSALGEMAGGVAHEINNPLAIINGRMALLRRLLNGMPEHDREKAKDIIASTERTIERIAKIIRGLLTFSRNAEKDPMKWESLSTLVVDCIELCEQRFKHAGVKLEVAIPEGYEVYCRSTQIAQVILNLLGNALDAVKPLPERWVRFNAEVVDEHRIKMIVTDSGHGIPNELADKIMQPFFTTKPVGQGTGLGLSISAGIIADHASRLSITRDSPHTQFCFEMEIRPTDRPSVEVA